MYRMSLPSLASQLAALSVLIIVLSIEDDPRGRPPNQTLYTTLFGRQSQIDDKFDDGNDPVVDIGDYRYMLTNSTRCRTAANVFGLSQGRVGSGDLWP